MCRATRQARRRCAWGPAPGPPSRWSARPRPTPCSTGATYVSPVDVQAMAVPSLAHRLVTDGDHRAAHRRWPRSWGHRGAPAMSDPVGRPRARRRRPGPVPPAPAGRRTGRRHPGRPGRLGGRRPQPAARAGSRPWARSRRLPRWSGLVGPAWACPPGPVRRGGRSGRRHHRPPGVPRAVGQPPLRISPGPPARRGGGHRVGARADPGDRARLHRGELTEIDVEVASAAPFGLLWWSKRRDPHPAPAGAGGAPARRPRSGQRGRRPGPGRGHPPGRRPGRRAPGGPRPTCPATCATGSTGRPRPTPARSWSARWSSRPTGRSPSRRPCRPTPRRPSGWPSGRWAPWPSCWDRAAG